MSSNGPGVLKRHGFDFLVCGMGTAGVAQIMVIAELLGGLGPSDGSTSMSATLPAAACCVVILSCLRFAPNSRRSHWVRVAVALAFVSALFLEGLFGLVGGRTVLDIVFEQSNAAWIRSFVWLGYLVLSVPEILLLARDVASDGRVAHRAIPTFQSLAGLVLAFVAPPLLPLAAGGVMGFWITNLSSTHRRRKAIVFLAMLLLLLIADSLENGPHAALLPGDLVPFISYMLILAPPLSMLAVGLPSFRMRRGPSG